MYVTRNIKFDDCYFFFFETDISARDKRILAVPTYFYSSTKLNYRPMFFNIVFYGSISSIHWVMVEEFV